MKIPPAIAAIAPNGQVTTAQRRRLMIDMCIRRVKPGSGSAKEFLLRRTAINPWPDLRPILQGIPWAIVGGVATRAYMPERFTKDLNILVHRRDGDDVLLRLQAAGYRIISRLAVPSFLLHSPSGIEVDIIFGDYRWLKTALAHTRQDAYGYPVLDLPYLVLMKIVSSRSQDWADVSRMLGQASEEELNRVRAVIKRYAPEVAEDLESFIYLGQLEMKMP